MNSRPPLQPLSTGDIPVDIDWCILVFRDCAFMIESRYARYWAEVGHELYDTSGFGVELLSFQPGEHRLVEHRDVQQPQIHDVNTSTFANWSAELTRQTQIVDSVLSAHLMRPTRFASLLMGSEGNTPPSTPHCLDPERDNVTDWCKVLRSVLKGEYLPHNATYINHGASASHGNRACIHAKVKPMPLDQFRCGELLSSDSSYTSPAPSHWSFPIPLKETSTQYPFVILTPLEPPRAIQPKGYMYYLGTFEAYQAAAARTAESIGFALSSLAAPTWHIVSTVQQIAHQPGLESGEASSRTLRARTSLPYQPDMYPASDFQSHQEELELSLSTTEGG